MVRGHGAGIGDQGSGIAQIGDWLDPQACPADRPPLDAMSAATRELHDAIDAHARRSGIPYLHPDEQTVGIHVDVRHMAPTKIGQSVTVTAELLEVKDNKIRYAVTATNDQGRKIGAGNHRRAVIHTRSFG